MSEVAIFSTSIDEQTYGPVAEILASRGQEPWIYRSDKVLTGEDRFAVNVSSEDNFTVQYNGINYGFDGLKSVWFRSPDTLNIDLRDKTKQLAIEQEVSALQESLWARVAEKAWLNHPAKMKRAQAKLAQLALAKELGFMIPPTVISNKWEEIDRLLESGPVVAKMSKGLLYDQGRAKVMYATVMNQALRSDLESANPFPAIYQAFIPKQKE